jgi:hypothetical protein
MQAEAFWHILVKLHRMPTTSHIYQLDDPLHVQSQQYYALHSYASIPRNTQCSQSVPSITISTLVSYVTYLSLIIFKIIPHPMTLLIAFPLWVIILYLILYSLFSLAYCHITYPLSSSHILSPRCQGTLAAYPPVTGQGRLNGCGSAKAGWVSSAAPAWRHAVSDIYTTDHNRLPSVDCDAFGLTANVLGIKVWVIPLHSCLSYPLFKPLLIVKDVTPLLIKKQEVLPLLHRTV